MTSLRSSRPCNEVCGWPTHQSKAALCERRGVVRAPDRSLWNWQSKPGTHLFYSHHLKDRLHPSSGPVSPTFLPSVSRGGAELPQLRCSPSSLCGAPTYCLLVCIMAMSSKYCSQFVISQATSAYNEVSFVGYSHSTSQSTGSRYRLRNFRILALIHARPKTNPSPSPAKSPRESLPPRK
jgi:hypothetical protein